MSLIDEQKPEIDPVADTIGHKLSTFPVPKSLWLYMFGSRGYDAYHKTKLDFGGDPLKLKAPARDPDTVSDRFVDRVHAYYADEGLVIVRRRNLQNPRAARPQDHMAVYTDLESGNTRRMAVIGYERSCRDYTRGGHVDTYILSDNSTDSIVEVGKGLQESMPHLVVDEISRTDSLGQLSLDGSQSQNLIDDLYQLEERAKTAQAYFGNQMGHIASMYQVATMAT